MDKRQVTEARNYSRAKPYEVVPIVLHGIVSGSRGTFDDICEETFLKLIRRISPKTVNLGDLYSGNDGGGRHWLLTFDDGNLSDFTVAFPALMNANATATFFLIPSLVGQPGYMNWSQIREMQAYGMDFGSHSLTHQRMSSIDSNARKLEFEISRLQIEAALGCEISQFAFPFGDYTSDLILEALRCGYKIVCVSDHGVISSPTQVVPRNSINGAMTFEAVDRTLNPTAYDRAAWKLEDWGKTLLKSTLGYEGYRSLRNLLMLR